MSILEIHGLTLRLGDRNILSDLSLDLWEGHVHAIVGPNGAGKSTLSSVIMGLTGYREIQGNILFEGHSITQLTTAERAQAGITMAWQEPARFEGLRVRDFMLAAAKVKTLENVSALLRDVGLDPQDYLDRCVDKTLSGGERKKIELASILAMRPKLALLDEPDSGIDIESLDKIFLAIKQLKDAKCTVVLITHSLAVLRQAEHAFLICDGTMVDKGPMAKIAARFEEKCMGCKDHQPAKEVEGA
jgi:Fe-S cluster assembly ATP-binding protein